MAVLTTSSVIASGVATLTENTLTASDTFTYNSGTGQVLKVSNPTAGALTLVIKGSSPLTNAQVVGAGYTVDLTAGLSVSLPIGAVKSINLDSVSAYLAGNGTVTVTGGTGGKAILFTLK